MEIQATAQTQAMQSFLNEKKQIICDITNNQAGTLVDYDCPKCQNRGHFFGLQGGNYIITPCSCMVMRQAGQRLRKSGLAELVENCTFAKFETPAAWQQHAKKLAEDFTHQTGKWFFIGGAVGSGKTHLCTAICGELILKGIDARYMLWRDDSRVLKSNINRDDLFAPRMNELKNIPVLYIDDLFKSKRGAITTDADVSIAFELLNFRYNNSNSITIISSEKTLEQIGAIDEAIASRIEQRARAYILEIRGNEKNWRAR